MFNSDLFKNMERLFEEQHKLFKTVFDHWDQPFVSLTEEKKVEKTEPKEENKEKCCCCERAKTRKPIFNDEERKRIREKLAKVTPRHTKNNKCHLTPEERVGFFENVKNHLLKKYKKNDTIEPFCQAISKLEQEENYQRCTVENMDKYAARIFSLINRDKEWDDDTKAIANVGIKIYFFAKLFFGGIRALDFYKYVLSIDPNFKKLVQTKNDEKLRKFRAEALAQLIKKDNGEEMYACEQPIFKNCVCNTTGCNRESSNGNYKSRVDLSGDNFVLRVVSTKNGGPRDGWYVELRKGEDEFAEVFNVTQSTKLADMINFVRSDSCECDDEEDV